MPSPSAPNAYPSGPSNYPSGPNIAPGASTFTGVGSFAATGATPFSGLVDDFTATSSEWTDSGASTANGGAYVNVSQNAGSAVYSSRRSRAVYSWPNTAVVLGEVAMPGNAGDTANAQLWVRDPAPANTVDRLGFEYVAASNTLVLRGQTGSGYAAIGADVSLPYDPVAHRWLKIEHTGSSIIWSTSPDGLTWTSRRTLASPPSWTTKGTLQLSLEGFRTSGTNDQLRVDSVNVPAPALPTTTPAATDALQQRTLDELRGFERWLTANSARGWVGEYGWVALYPGATGAAAWSALGELYSTELDAAGLSGTVWASGREWGNGYPLGAHVGTNPGDALTISNALAAQVVANHPTRGAGSSTRWRGVSLAGYERGISTSGGGTVRTASPYVHTTADFAYLAGQGVDLVRLPVAWERLQPTLGAALDTTALGVLDGMLTAARQAGVRVLLDLHNYGRYTNSDGSVVALGGGLSNAQFTDFWTRLVTWLTGNATRSGVVVALGLMNEPHDLPGGAASWTSASQAAVTAIRQGGDNRLLLVAGYGWSSLTNWGVNHPTGWITDPSSNFCYEPHHYWDTASVQGTRSGTYQQSDGAGGQQIETYSTELAAAVSQASNPAAFTGEGTWSAAPVRSTPAGASLTGAGSLGGSAALPAAKASLAGVGQLGGAAYARTSTTGLLSGEGWLGGVAGLVVRAAAALSGSGSLGVTSTTSTADAGPAALAGVGTVGIDATTYGGARPSIGGEGSLGAAPLIGAAGRTTLVGVGQLGASAALSPRRNLLPNPSAVLDLAGWGFVDSGARLTGLGAPWERSTAARATVTSTAAGYAEVRTPAYSPGGDLTGLPFTGSVRWAASSIDAAPLYVFLVFADADGTPLGFPFVIPDVTPNTPARTVVTGTAPAGTRQVAVWVRGYTVPVGYQLTVGAARLEQSTDPALPYADGDSADWTWDAAAEASSSTQQLYRAALTGIGSLALTSTTRVAPGQAALAGVGTLGVNAFTGRAGAGALAGVGQLGGPIQRTTPAAAGWSGVGSFGPSSASLTEVATVSLTGVGALGALAFVGFTTSLSGAGSLGAPTAVLTEAAGAALAGVGSLGASAIRSTFTAAGWSGVGAWAGPAQIGMRGAAGLTGVGALAATIYATRAIDAALTGIGALGGPGYTARPARVSLTGLGVFGGSALWPIAPGQAALTGIGAFAAAARIAVRSGPVALAGIGMFGATAYSWTPIFVTPRGPVRPQTHAPRNRLLVVETITGKVMWDLPFTALSWNAPLNKIGDYSVTIPIEATLERVRAQGAANPRNAVRAFALGPYRFSMVVAFGNAAVAGGPLLPSDDEDDGTITLGGSLMEKMLENRVLLNRAAGLADGLNNAARDVTAANTNVAGAILALVAAATTDYDGSGSRLLPITCSNPPDTRGATTFSWPAYDLSDSWKAITDLIARPDDGPDVRLEPYLYDGADGQYVAWDLQIGSPTFPPSGNYGPDGPLPWTWDDTVCKIKPTVDATGLASSYFGSGSGQDRDKVLAVADSTRLTRLGFPALEKTDTTSNTDGSDPAAVQRRVNSLIDAHQTPTDSWNVDVPINGAPQLGQFRRGDVARLNVRRKLLIEPGYYERRITKVSGTGGSKWATVTCDHEDELAGV